MDELVLSQWAAMANVPLRFTGSYQRDDTGEEIAVKSKYAVSTSPLTSVKPNRAKTPKPKSPVKTPISN